MGNTDELVDSATPNINDTKITFKKKNRRKEKKSFH